MGKCQQCDKEFEPNKKGKPRLFCNIKCQQKFYYKKNNKKMLDMHKKWYTKQMEIEKN